VSAAPARQAPAPVVTVTGSTSSNRVDVKAPQQPQQPIDKKTAGGGGGGSGSGGGAGDVAVVDYTQIPTQLEAKYGELDVDGALRPTIINTSTDGWTRKSWKSLLADPTTQGIGVTEQGTERQRAFDLMDALTKSGDLTIEQASLHVVIAATHCFDKTLINTVIQDNVNPIEKVERSSLIVASTIHQIQPHLLIQPSHINRLAMYSPMLISDEALALAKAGGADDKVVAKATDPAK